MTALHWTLALNYLTWLARPEQDVETPNIVQFEAIRKLHASK
jgi:hypothetical protein